MLEVNQFTGNTYNTFDTVKIRQDGQAFIRQGDVWFGPDGQVIQQESNVTRSLNTGIPSVAGDPFGGNHDEL